MNIKQRKWFLSFLSLISILMFSAPVFAGFADECTDQNTWKPDFQKGQDIEIKNSTVCIGPGAYHYGFVNIHSKGKLIFKDAAIDFWAKSILVENEGSLLAGSPEEPIGKGDIVNHKVIFHLYGSDGAKGITCKLPNCGIPDNAWNDGGSTKVKMPVPAGTPDNKIISDYFYKYENLPTYRESDGFAEGDYYFGRKVLAVAYGGTIRMFGRKGATYGDVEKAALLKKPVKKGDTTLELSRFADWKPGQKILIFDMTNPSVPSEVLIIKELKEDPTDEHAIITIKGSGIKNIYSDVRNYRVMYMKPSGTSWTRLNAGVAPGADTLVLDRAVDWQEGDQIVLTTTDYLPGHSELFTIKKIVTDPDKNMTRITVNEKIAYAHNGAKYPVPKAEMPAGIKDKVADAVDTRAAVALLSRNIRIVSAGDNDGDKLPDNSFFGGHTIVRQGALQYQLQGVELYQLGQGGRMAHSPVNFHLVRQAPLQTFVADCSAWDSMTRWYELRGVQGVMLNRNVGYKSIGHGYFLAEGTETLNLLQGNIGIYARPAIDYPDNPRKVPGVIAKTDGFANDAQKTMFLAYGGDYIHPSVFFIMNGYNNFEDNMAVGAGTCGACYWFAPGVNSGLSSRQSWEGYAGIQRQTPGAAPIKSFHGNFCSTAQHSLITIDTPGTCQGVNVPGLSRDHFAFDPITNGFARCYNSPPNDRSKPELYPVIQSGAVLQSRRCDLTHNPACDTGKIHCEKGDTSGCAVNVIDSYTSSFHWAQQNVAAVWLRFNWFLFTDSALTDVLHGGLTMVSGGSWDQVYNQYWALTRNSIFVGSTQDGNPYASNLGPVNPGNKIRCKDGSPAAYCLLQDTDKTKDRQDEGVVIPINTFALYSRLYNIYDGPVYQESNAYLHIKKAPIDGCDPELDNRLVPGTCKNNNYTYWRAQGIPRAKEDPYKHRCVLPNAAIGWKQPNGFYYPPAFHSRNLFFNDVDIRHFIIVPIFKPGTLEVDVPKLQAEYCTYPPGAPANLFDNTFTDVDRQTELNDDDGTLTGLKGANPQQIGAGAGDDGGTIAINTDKFFDAPRQTLECLSEETCLQSPYDYVTAVIYPECAQAAFGACGNDKWGSDCQKSDCYGVPIYRQYLNAGEKPGEEQGIRMMGTGIAQRSILLANNGRYYINTTKSGAKQYLPGSTTNLAPFRNVFEKGKKYNFFLLYTKPTSRVTLQLYIGKNLAPGDVQRNVKMIRVGTKMNDGFVLRTTPLVTTPDDNWPESWKRDYKQDTGILEITMDLTAAQFQKSFDDGLKESCGPPSFCQWQANPGGKGGACVYAKDQKDIDYRGDDSICGWSVKAAECPSGGCYGFQLALTTDVTDDLNHRPDPTPFPDSWNVAWITADKADSGDSRQPEFSTKPLEIDSVNPEKCKATDTETNCMVINLKSPGIEAPGEHPYTTVKRTDASGQITGWAWLKKLNKGETLDKQVLHLDRKVDWKSGDKVVVFISSTCVYSKGKVPPTPAYIWDVVSPK